MLVVEPAEPAAERRARRAAVLSARHRHHPGGDAVVGCLRSLPAGRHARHLLQPPCRSTSTPSRVTCDNVGGGAMVADFLLDSGHGGLAFVSGRPDASTNRDRWTGFSARMPRPRTPGPDPRAKPGRSFTYERRIRGAPRACLRGPARPDALFCANDILAVGAFDAIAARRRLRARHSEDDRGRRFRRHRHGVAGRPMRSPRCASRSAR